jgi:adenylate kinase family enzyme
MRRIVVIGPLAAGKSTLAVELGQMLGIPVHHLDWLYWGDIRTPTPPAEWQALLDQLVAGESWIIDGNFTSSMRQRLVAADTVIYLDTSPVISTIRATKRRIFHRWRRAPGVSAVSRPMFNAQLFRWIWEFRRHSRPQLLGKLREPPFAHKTIVLRTPREVRRFLQAVGERVGETP